ncbi:hypothetical protein P4O66_001286 [Electrophorus voltai]|uniref:Uncharacterized protein n=1 Tax=Electrophorus voltai TaxID=2609070 RepID=A0AAD8ZAU7_9TELE|nr:hypothetical protein P4O66_001286 [Electrophorus voltai]
MPGSREPSAAQRRRRDPGGVPGSDRVRLCVPVLVQLKWATCVASGTFASSLQCYQTYEKSSQPSATCCILGVYSPSSGSSPGATGPVSRCGSLACTDSPAIPSLALSE